MQLNDESIWNQFECCEQNGIVANSLNFIVNISSNGPKPKVFLYGNIGFSLVCDSMRRLNLSHFVETISSQSGNIRYT